MVIYAEDFDQVLFTVRQCDAGDNEVILLPFDGSSESGSWTRDGIVLADPLQIIMDCFGEAYLLQSAETLTQEWS